MLRSIDRTSDRKASEQAYSRLRQRVVSLDLEPGSIIHEKQLCEELGLGRTPVREALLRLADKQLVEIRPRKGTVVAPIRLEAFKKVEELRWEMESLATRWAAERISAPQLAEMRRLIEDAEAGAFVDIRDWDVEVDRSFHLMVAEAAHNPFLSQTLDQLYDHSVRLLYATRAEISAAVEELADYRFIVDALAERDGDRASYGMHVHLTHSIEQNAERFRQSLATTAWDGIHGFTNHGRGQ